MYTQVKVVPRLPFDKHEHLQCGSKRDENSKTDLLVLTKVDQDVLYMCPVVTNCNI